MYSTRSSRSMQVSRLYRYAMNLVVVSVVDSRIRHSDLHYRRLRAGDEEVPTSPIEDRDLCEHVRFASSNSQLLA